MVQKMFSIYDSKAEAYFPPFCMQTKGQAIRGFSDMANDPKHNFCVHGEDFTLFEIGTFDDSSCRIELYDARISLGNAVEFRKVKAEPMMAL